MADFKRYALAFAGFAAFLGATGTASAQFNNFNCTAQASTPFQQRAEGITEQAGDIFVVCTGGTVVPAGTTVPTVNISIQLNTQLTSRLLGGSANATDALLLINDPSPATQFLCPASSTIGGTCPALGTGAGGAIGNLGGQYNGGAGHQNAFQGQLVAPNQVTFFAVPIDPPGPQTSATVIPSLTLRITNVRDNASALGAPTGFTSTAVTAVVSTSAGFNISNPVQTVGNIFRGLLPGGVGSAGFVSNTSTTGTASLTANSLGISSSSFGVGTGTSITLQQCASRSLSTTGSNALIGYINFQEGFATSTKLQVPGYAYGSALGVPGNFLNTESGFQLNGSAASGYGVADFGTRVKLTFANIPAGTTLYVPTTVLSQQTYTGSTLPQFVTTAMRLTATEGGVFSAVSASTTSGLPATAANGFAALTASAGGVVAVYEVTGQAYNNNVSVASGINESFTVPFLVQYTASPATNSPAVGTSTVQVDYAPTSTVVTASSGPIPRFIQTSPVTNLFTINSCSTVLLFPFVTNQAGFDTGIAIANTSTDPFGTSPQVGTCTLNFYGSAAPAAFTSASVASGTVYTTLASSVSAGFQGYMIAQCGFQFAHGFAFVTDGFGGPGRGLSQGYLPLIIPDPRLTSRAANNQNQPAAGTGEGLGN